MPEKPNLPDLLKGPDLTQRDDTLAQIIEDMPLLVDPILSGEFPGQECIRSDNLSFTLCKAFDAGVLAAVRSLAAQATNSGVDLTSIFAEVLKVDTGPNMLGLRQNDEENN